MDGTTRVYLFRNAYSCGNYKKEVGGISRLIKTLRNDPALTMYGVLQTLLQNTDDIPLDSAIIDGKSMFPIYVSCLMRSWQTAILLFGHRVPVGESRDLLLKITPFIKESGAGLDNSPVSFEEQLDTITNFIAVLRGLSHIIKREKPKGTWSRHEFGVDYFSNIEKIERRVNSILALTSIAVEMDGVITEIKMDVDPVHISSRYLRNITRMINRINNEGLVDRRTRAREIIGGTKYTGDYLSSNIFSAFDRMLVLNPESKKNVIMVVHKNIMRSFFESCSEKNKCQINIPGGITTEKFRANTDKFSTFCLDITLKYRGVTMTQVERESVAINRFIPGQQIPGDDIRFFIDECELQCGNYNYDKCSDKLADPTHRFPTYLYGGKTRRRGVKKRKTRK
jgi:hypothetical protein